MGINGCLCPSWAVALWRPRRGDAVPERQSLASRASYRVGTPTAGSDRVPETSRRRGGTAGAALVDDNAAFGPPSPSRGPPNVDRSPSCAPSPLGGLGGHPRPTAAPALSAPREAARPPPLRNRPPPPPPLPGNKNKGTSAGAG